MNTSYEQIERYVEGKMEASEKEAFEGLIATSNELTEEVKSFRELTSQLTSFGKRKELKTQLDAFHKEMERGNLSTTKRKTVFFGSYKVISVAASIMLVGCMAVFWLFLNSHTDRKEHYQELRRDVERIKQSQNNLVKAFNEEKKAFSLNKYSGTGFAVSRDGYVLTSYHIVKNADSVVLENDKYKRLKAAVVYSDAQLDMALLKVESAVYTKWRPIPYGFSSPLHEMGERIFTMGYPKEEIVYSEGYIGSQSGYEGDSTSYQIALPVNPGNSGGPLLDAKGQVIGLVSGKHRESEGAAFALKSKHIKVFVKNWNDQNPKNRLALPIYASMGASSRTQQIRVVQDFVFKIKVY